MPEMPSITGSAYVSNAFDTKALLAVPAVWGDPPEIQPDHLARMFAKSQPGPVNLNHQGNTMSAARIVKVFIADPNENLPLDKRVIYSGDEKLTDSTDQELFFEVPIGDLLAKQNELRAATLDKKASEKSGRDIFLEPARIRDLKMVVVTVAQF